MYADDLKLAKIITDGNDVVLLQEDVDRLADWCKANGMELNPAKCFFISFTRKRSVLNANYTIENNALQRLDYVRDLGITFDSKLRFNLHIDNICRSARKMLGFVFRNSKPFKKFETKKLLYTSLVRSKLEYATVIWNPSYQIYKDRIESIQRRFTMFNLRSNERLSYSIRLKACHLDSLSDRRKLHDIVFLYKLVNGAIDNPELLSQVSLKTPSHLPRHPINPLTHKLHRTNLGYHSILPRLCRLHKELIVKDKTIDLFCDKIGKFKAKVLSTF